jgi:hypothetical protein
VDELSASLGAMLEAVEKYMGEQFTEMLSDRIYGQIEQAFDQGVGAAYEGFAAGALH